MTSSLSFVELIAWISTGLIILTKEHLRQETKSGMLQSCGDGRRSTELAGDTISTGDRIGTGGQDSAIH